MRFFRVMAAAMVLVGCGAKSAGPASIVADQTVTVTGTVSGGNVTVSVSPDPVTVAVGQKIDWVTGTNQAAFVDLHASPGYMDKAGYLDMAAQQNPGTAQQSTSGQGIKYGVFWTDGTHTGFLDPKIIITNGQGARGR